MTQPAQGYILIFNWDGYFFLQKDSESTNYQPGQLAGPKHGGSFITYPEAHQVTMVSVITPGHTPFQTLYNSLYIHHYNYIINA